MRCCSKIRGFPGITEFILLPLLMMTALPVPIFCQSPFSHLTLGFGVQNEFADGLYQQYWQSEANFTASANMPFYIGEVCLLGTYNKMIPVASDDIHFTDTGIRLVWQFRTADFAGFSWAAGPSVGAHFFILPHEISYGQLESEIALGIMTSMRLRMTESWMLQLSAMSETVYTQLPMRSLAIGGQVQYGFAAPRFLRELLR